MYFLFFFCLFQLLEESYQFQDLKTRIYSIKIIVNKTQLNQPGKRLV